MFEDRREARAMELNAEDPISTSEPANDSELDLYTIPTYSRWFSWDDIHETERISLSEFFDGSSITRTHKIYKEYRDFIITKYREEPSRRLTFAEVRKSLVGDVSLLHKVFLFLEKWGLINFSAASDDGGGLLGVTSVGSENGEAFKFRAEEGPPHGVRVVINPNSLKPVSVLPCVGDNGECEFKSPPLASHYDVFGDVTNRTGLTCSNCGRSVDSGRYEHLKGSCTICVACFQNGAYGENMSAEDFKLEDCSENNASSEKTVWTEAENLLLLESVLKHGDDWELVAQCVRTKTKLECISRLIEMPFGDLMLGSLREKNAMEGTDGDDTSCGKQVQLDSLESHETSREDLESEMISEVKQNGVGEDEGPSLKRNCTLSRFDSDGSLMKQVAHISGRFDPVLTTAAAEAAATALCKENPIAEGLLLAPGKQDSGMKEMATRDMASENGAVPLSVRVRAAVAAALGAAGAHAMLLANEETREMEHLVGTIIKSQVRKMQWKARQVEALREMMEGEYDRMRAAEEGLIEERVGVLEQVFIAGIPTLRTHVGKPS